MQAGGEFNKISFHARALGSSFKESFVEMAQGMEHFFWNDRIEFSNRVHNRAREQFGVGYKYTGPWGEGFVRLFANATYLVGRTFTDTGEAIGTGAAMMVAGKNGEEVALGASAFISGLCGGATLGLAPFTPSPTIPNPTITSSSGGNVAVMTMAGAYAYAVPASNLAAGVLVGAATAASSNDFGGPMAAPRSVLRKKPADKPAGIRRPTVVMEDFRGITVPYRGRMASQRAIAKAFHRYYFRDRRYFAPDPNESVRIIISRKAKNGTVVDGYALISSERKLRYIVFRAEIDGNWLYISHHPTSTSLPTTLQPMRLFHEVPNP